MGGDPLFVSEELLAHVDALEERAFARTGLEDGERAALDLWRAGAGEAQLLDEVEVEQALYREAGRRGAISDRLAPPYRAGFLLGWEAWRTAREISEDDVDAALHARRRAA